MRTTKTTTESEHPEQAQAFVDYLYTPEAQRVFADKGYRPVKKSLVDKKKYPTPKTLFTIEEFGGWAEVMTKFFDKENGVVAEIEKEIGVPTDG